MPIADAQPFKSNHLLGVLLTLAGGITLSTGGTLVRLFEDTDGWTIMFYRGLSFFAMMFVIVCFRSRGRVVERYRAIDATGLAIGVCLGLGLISYLFAMLNTTVANVYFVVGASPLVTALLAWLVLGERISLRTGVILTAALLGIGVMVAEGLATGRMLGNVIALGTLGTFAVFVILLRKARAFDMLAATSLAGLVAAAVAAFMADTLYISLHDLILAIIFGAVQIGLGFTFITYAARHIPAAELMLLSLSESILGPVWVWLVVAEVPSVSTLLGGAIVLGCVGLYAMFALYEHGSGRAAP